MAKKLSNKSNDFNIKLSFDVDYNELRNSVQTSLSNMPFKIKLDVDASEINKATQFTNKVKNNKTDTNFITEDLVSEIRNSSDAIDSFIVSTDNAGNAIQVVTTEYNNLNEVITKTWSLGAESVDDYTKQVTKNTTGVKQNLKLQEQNERAVYKLEKAIDSYSSQTKISKKETADFTQKLKDIENQGLSPIEKSKALDKLNTDLKAAANSTGILGQSFSKAMVKYVTWLGIATIVSKVVNTLKQMVSAVIELDSALVELNKVWDATDSQLRKLTNDAFNLANATGRTGIEVINAITEFKRMGYTIEQSKGLAEVATIMTNIAEGITDTKEAANILVSVLKGIGVSAEYAESVLDRLNNVSNNNAVTFDALANMTKEAAATMNILGNNLDQTIGLLTGSYEILQDEKVAKGIQTIGLRIAGLNEDMETQAGLSNQVTKALQRYAGINAFDDEGQIKNTYTILKELSGVWDDLNKNEQSALLNTLAGKERADVASALLKNWDAVDKAIQDSANSVGSARKEQEAYLKSIQASINEFKNTFQELSTQIINSELIKFVINIGTAIFKIIGEIVRLIVTIVEFAAKVTGITTALKGILVVLQAVGKIFDSINYAVEWLFEQVSKLKDVPVLGWLLSLGENVINGIGNWVNSWGTDDANKEQKDLAETFNQSQKELSEYDKALEKLTKDLKEYNSELNSNLELIDKENKKLEQEKDIQEKLLAVEKARQALAEARNRRSRVYRVGVGLVYSEDTNEVQKAQESLQGAVDDLIATKYDIALSRANEFVEQLNEILSGDDITQGWAELFDEFGDLLDTEFSSYIIKAKEFINQFNDVAGSAGIQVSLSGVGNNASGTMNWSGGPTWVGENGPEILNLPRGSEILSNSRSMKLHDIVSNPSAYVNGNSSFGGGKVVNINGPINLPNVSNAKDFIDELSKIGNGGIVSFA